MKVYGNQKLITVHRNDPEGRFTVISLKSIDQAAMNLKDGAFKLWIFFCKNQNNYTFAPSSSVLMRTFNMKKNKYDNAIHELIEKGYLVQDKANPFEYIFVERPEE